MDIIIGAVVLAFFGLLAWERYLEHKEEIARRKKEKD